MGIFNNFPYTNFHELNLDWILEKVKDLGNKIDTMKELPKGGSTGQTLQKVSGADYDYGWANIPAGPQGPQGPTGQGVPSGGTTGQILRKTSGTDYATEWATVNISLPEIILAYDQRISTTPYIIWQLTSAQSTAIKNADGLIKMKVEGQDHTYLVYTLLRLQTSDADPIYMSFVQANMTSGGRAQTTFVTFGLNIANDRLLGYNYTWDEKQFCPTGGSTNQVLMKNSNNNYDYSWKTINYLVPTVLYEYATPTSNQGIVYPQIDLSGYVGFNILYYANTTYASDDANLVETGLKKLTLASSCMVLQGFDNSASEVGRRIVSYDADTKGFTINHGLDTDGDTDDSKVIVYKIVGYK